ncbi:PREDICTED: WD repeat-containing protein 90-like isoform X2 [Priapulus caudatus]|nr:PREDICTED: WD repeat-containing protein 90-like isoform X2 [Priapulus caudatus]
MNSIHEASVTTYKHDLPGPAPPASLWTVLQLDMQAAMSNYMHRHFSHVKCMRLCASMLVKNIITSDKVFSPDSVKNEVGDLAIYPLPRVMRFPLEKGESWQDCYAYIRIPYGVNVPQSLSINTLKSSIKRSPTTKAKARMLNRVMSGPPHVVNKPVEAAFTKTLQIHQEADCSEGQLCGDLTSTTSAPLKCSTARHRGNCSVMSDRRGDVHIYASRGDRITTHRTKSQEEVIVGETLPARLSFTGVVEHDPLLKLHRVVGFSTDQACITADGKHIVYPAHAIIVAVSVETGQQRFFTGHTNRVSGLALRSSPSPLLASGEVGKRALVRLWEFESGRCVAVAKAHHQGPLLLEFSACGRMLCGVGRDARGQHLLVMWSVVNAERGVVDTLARGHTDVDIAAMSMDPVDSTRFVTGGKGNLQLWRVRDGTLRSCSVNMRDYAGVVVTDVCYRSAPDGGDTLVCASSNLGFVFDVNPNTASVARAMPLLPDVGELPDDKSGVTRKGGVLINGIAASHGRCATASEDGALRVWSRDFASVLLEAEHASPARAVRWSDDGAAVVVTTRDGSIAAVDVNTETYTTLMRSHTDEVSSMDVDASGEYLATVADDGTVRVWALATSRQLYDFSVDGEVPCNVSFHPSKAEFACGFLSGRVTVFSVSDARAVSELKQLRGQVIGLAFCPSTEGSVCYCDQFGSLVLYHSSGGTYRLVRSLPNMVCRNTDLSPSVLAVCQSGQYVACIGPSEYLVTIMDTAMLNEILRLDVNATMLSDTPYPTLDTAVRVSFIGSQESKEVLVATSCGRLLKFDSTSGKLTAQRQDIHAGPCSALTASTSGRLIITAGDNIIKVWPSSLRMDVAPQLFTGHSSPVTALHCTADGGKLLSTGDTIFVWDMHTTSRSPNCVGVPPTDLLSDQRQRLVAREEDEAACDVPDYSSVLADMSSVSAIKLDSTATEVPVKPEDPVCLSPIAEEVTRRHSLRVNSCAENAARDLMGDDCSGGATSSPPPALDHTHKPNAKRHFFTYGSNSPLAQRRYTALENEAGLKLDNVIGYNGNGRNNMVWNPTSGLFAYTSGCIVVVENLHDGQQRHLLHHEEEISTLALQHDSSLLASASGSDHPAACCQIYVWDTQTFSCKVTLSQHKHNVVCMDFSRDARFFIAAGDYREPRIVIWSTYDWTVTVTTIASFPIHQLCWDMYHNAEFVTVGEEGKVCFWMLEENESTPQHGQLCLHEPEIPEELLYDQAGLAVNFTAACYTGKNTLFLGTSNGKLSLWDTSSNTCTAHWTASSSEIGVIAGRGNNFVIGNQEGVKLWNVASLVGPQELGSAVPGQMTSGASLQGEMELDGYVTSVAFEENLNMGIVGTASGTLWYMNFSEHTSLQLVSGHGSMVTNMACLGTDHLVTSCDDGSLRVWLLASRELVMQFKTTFQSCDCLAASPVDLDTVLMRPVGDKIKTGFPLVVAGYTDGSIRLFDLNKTKMLRKTIPHKAAITAITFSDDGQVIVSGTCTGHLAVSSAVTGHVIRTISDHHGASITDIRCSPAQKNSVEFGEYPSLWLAASNDQRVSVWAADWSLSECELLDWLTFPSLPETENKDLGRIPSLACFNPVDPSVIFYVGYGLQKAIQMYCLRRQQVLKSIPLLEWACCLDLSPDGSFMVVGTIGRLVKLVDLAEESFQDFPAHSHSVQCVRFTQDGASVATAAGGELYVWSVHVT